MESAWRGVFWLRWIVRLHTRYPSREAQKNLCSLPGYFVYTKKIILKSYLIKYYLFNSLASISRTLGKMRFIPFRCNARTRFAFSNNSCSKTPSTCTGTLAALSMYSHLVKINKLHSHEWSFKHLNSTF